MLLKLLRDLMNIILRNYATTQREDEEDATAIIERGNEPEAAFEYLKAELINI